MQNLLRLEIDDMHNLLCFSLLFLRIENKENLNDLTTIVNRIFNPQPRIHATMINSMISQMYTTNRFIIMPVNNTSIYDRKRKAEKAFAVCSPYSNPYAWKCSRWNIIATTRENKNREDMGVVASKRGHVRGLLLASL